MCCGNGLRNTSRCSKPRPYFKIPVAKNNIRVKSKTLNRTISSLCILAAGRSDLTSSCVAGMGDGPHHLVSSTIYVTGGFLCATIVLVTTATSVCEIGVAGKSFCILGKHRQKIMNGVGHPKTRNKIECPICQANVRCVFNSRFVFREQCWLNLANRSKPQAFINCRRAN